MHHVRLLEISEFDGSAKHVNRKRAPVIPMLALFYPVNVFFLIRPFSDVEQTLDPASCVLPETNDGMLYI